MNWKRVFATLLAASVLAVAGVAVQAEEKKVEEKKIEEKKVETIKPPAGAVVEGTVPTPHHYEGAIEGGCGSCASVAGSGDCGPQYTTVWVTEYTPETYAATRTVLKPTTSVERYTAYRTESVAERFTAYRTECVAEQRTRNVTVNRMVAETRTEMRTVWTCVPTVENRTVTKTVCVTKPVTTFECVKRDMGHWECQEEVACPGFLAKCRHKLSGECGEPCPEVKTKKVWCANMVTEQVPVTKYVKSHECVTEVVQVTVMQKVASQQPHTFTVNRCVPETHTETFTVQVPHQVAFESTRMVCHTVPYEATRTVVKCVPVEESYTATRMVAHQVAKQVAVAPAVAECSTCGERSKSCKFGGFLSKFKKHGCGCD